VLQSIAYHYLFEKLVINFKVINNFEFQQKKPDVQEKKKPTPYSTHNKDGRLTQRAIRID